MSVLSGLCILLFAAAILDAAILNAAKYESGIDILEQTNKLLSYLDKHRTRLNLDAILGLQIYKSMLEALIRTNPQLRPRLLRQALWVDSLTSFAGPTLQSRTPFYYHQMKDLIAADLWKAPLPAGSLKKVYLYGSRFPNETFNERLGDECFRQLLGSSRYSECTVSGECGQLMTRPGFVMYSLTHQLFYFLIGIEKGCTTQLELLAKTAGRGSVRAILDTLCTNIFKDTSEMIVREHMEEYKDIVMEQIGFCGYAGYAREFGSSAWLQLVASWMLDPPGCYGIEQEETFNRANLEPSRYGNYKRAEAMLDNSSADRCLAHKSAVALVAYGTFLLNKASSSVGMAMTNRED